MLRSLSVRDFAIIEALSVEFDSGLNVLTGETGAGKSILIGALGLILGGRADASMIRSGSSRAIIDGLFDVAGAPGVIALLEEAGFDAPDGELLLSREIADTAKSTARINGRPATVAQLREIGDLLVDLHGQHEHQSLLAVRRHLGVLDEWGAAPVQVLLSEVAQAWSQVRSIERDLAETETDSRERARLVDLLTFQVSEITKAGLEVGEDSRLAADALRLRSTQKLRDAAAAALEAIRGGRTGSVLDGLVTASREAASLSELDPLMTSPAETLQSARYDIEEAVREIERYQASLEDDPGRLDAVEARLSLIADLKRKYGETIEEVLAFADGAARRLDDLTGGEARSQDLRRRLDEATVRYAATAGNLSARRREVAADFTARVIDELSQLAMERALFEVALTDAPPSVSGQDACEFLLTTNPGEPPRPLVRVASGGEISRVMLAIKSAMSSRSPLPTMVFDEVDAGIGGRTASVVADKLRALASTAQVLCITHLHQIAARADHHYRIEKRPSGDRTVVGIEPLSDDERIEEIARMLAGADITETVRSHVREMLASR